MKHEGRVRFVVVSTDERQILSRDDGTLRLWDAATGRPIGAPMKHDGNVSSGRFTKDGRRILSWSAVDRTVRLWDAATGTLIGDPMMHDKRVFGARLVHDDRHILSVSAEGTLQLWDAAINLPAGEVMHIGDRQSGVVSVAPDGGRALFRSYDGMLQLWDTANGKAIGDPMQLEGVVGAQFAPDGQHILSWSEDGTLRLWDAGTGAPAAPPMKHHPGINGAQFARNGRTILVWSDQTVDLLDLATGKQIGNSMQHEGVRGALFSPNGDSILSWSEDGRLHLWGAAPAASATPPVKHGGKIMGAQFTPNGRTILVWSDQTVDLLDLATGKQIGDSMQHEGVRGARCARRRPYPVMVVGDVTAVGYENK